MAAQLQGFPTAPLADPNTGIITAAWRQFLVTLWNRTYISRVATGIVAAGTRIDTATPINADWNEVTLVPSGSGVGLPALTAGQGIIVINAGANSLNVYPASSYMIDALSTGAPYVLASGKMQWFRTIAATSSQGRMRSMQLG